MTDRFSPEYIKFILSDEASVLQERWKVNIGNWFCTSDGASLWLVTAVFREGIEAFNTSRSFSWPYQPDEFGKDELAEVQWLPSLTDLLDMIEEAGYWWSTSLDYDGDDRWYTISAGSIEAGGYIENDHEDRMAAAATLAVRVLEEGKE